MEMKAKRSHKSCEVVLWEVISGLGIDPGRITELLGQNRLRKRTRRYAQNVQRTNDKIWWNSIAIAHQINEPLGRQQKALDVQARTAARSLSKYQTALPTAGSWPSDSSKPLQSICGLRG
jgi:hypothetical protein